MSEENVSGGKVSQGIVSQGNVFKGKVSGGKVSEGKLMLITNITYYVANLKLDSIDISQYDYQMQFEFP